MPYQLNQRKDKLAKSFFDSFGLTSGKICVILYYRSILWGCKDRIQKFRDRIREYPSRLQKTVRIALRGWKNPL